MNFDSERYAEIIDKAIEVKQDIFEHIGDLLGKDLTEDDAVIFFSALSVMSDLTAQLARVVSGLPAERVKQLLREDTVRRKIILNGLLPNVLPEVTKELGSSEITNYLESVEYFGYPDSEIARWDMVLKLDVAQ